MACHYNLSKGGYALSKTIQIRVSEQEHAFIKNAFKNDNLSKIVRNFLLEQADERITNSDMSLQEDDSSIQSFMEMLSNPVFQETLYKLFKSSKGGV